MGWWSQSSSSVKNEQQQPEPAPTLTPTPTLTSTPKSTQQEQEQQQQQSSPSHTEPTEQPPLTRDEQADNELRDFLQSLESSTSPTSTHTHSELTNDTSSSSSSSSPETSSPPKSISPDSLYPDTMSCRSAFDYAFFCQSFGGQWVNVYRYGELRSCNEHWENFWLCMKARGFKGADEERKEMIRNHYRKKAIKYKTGPSSEDVWEVRVEPVRRPFEGELKVST